MLPEDKFIVISKWSKSPSIPSYWEKPKDHTFQKGLISPKPWNLLMDKKKPLDREKKIMEKKNIH